MKSYNLELLKISGLDFLFKRDIKSKKVDLAETSSQAFEQESSPIVQANKPSLDMLKVKYSNCQKCPLHENRKKFVYGQGNPNADLMIIGEGPGQQEDQSGQVFVGPAGQLLTKMLKAINIERDQVYITNIVKCHPPHNRDPFPAEREACLPYLIEQIEIVKPKVILLLGKVAATSLLPHQENASLSSFRNKEHYYQNIRTFVSYHPSALLRNASYKLPAWHDLQHIQHYLENLN